METGKRHIKSGVEFEKYIEEPTGINESIKRNSNLEDTVRFLPDAIQRSYQQAALMAPLLKGLTTYDTCRKIWNWAYNHIQYEKDDKGKEQIRSFRRSFYERVRGIDCDDYTVLISSLLCCLNIKHILRVAKYSVKNGYQHIYPIVPIGNGNYITVDCVVDKFNYEVPFIQKIDTTMDLEFLDGIGDLEETNIKLSGIDAQDLMDGFDGFGDLGKKKFKDSKLAKGLKKGFHVANRVNPGAALLRAGVLAAMKTNMFKIAERLRYAYLDSNAASQKNLNMSKFNRLVSVKEKLEKIYYGAGGKTENLKKAILTGRGNRNKEVPLSGLGDIDYNDYTEEDDLTQILGMESYASEMSGVEGLGSLGVVTAAAVAAATSALAAIAGLLKSIGNLKNGGKEGGGDASDGSAETSNTSDTSSESSASSDNSETNQNSTSSDDNAETTTNSTSNAKPSSTTDANSGGGENKADTAEPPANEDTSASDDSAKTNARLNTNTAVKSKEGFVDKAKKWISENKVATGAIAVTVIGLTIWGISAYNKKKKTSEKSGVAGIPKKSGYKKTHKSKHGNHHKPKITYQKLR